MCDALYVASDRLLPLINYDEDNPALWVGELGSFEKEDKLVIRQFSLPYVYYIGAHTCCGCGFGKRRPRKQPNLLKRALNLFRGKKEKLCDSAGSDFVLNAAVNLTYKQLVHYLWEAKRQGGRLELFYCFTGNQGQQPWSRETIRIIDIESEAFCFSLMHYYEVID
jgi:hypothetical protein